MRVFGCAWGFEFSGWMGSAASHASRRSPDDFMLTAGGRAPPFGDLANRATAAGADAGTAVQLANLVAGGWRTRGHLLPQPFCVPYRKALARNWPGACADVAISDKQRRCQKRKQAYRSSALQLRSRLKHGSKRSRAMRRAFDSSSPRKAQASPACPKPTR
jgi:hypothetical protein